MMTIVEKTRFGTSVGELLHRSFTHRYSVDKPVVLGSTVTQPSGSLDEHAVVEQPRVTVVVVDSVVADTAVTTFF